MGHGVEKDARSTHDVYRIGGDFSYQEAPCFCPARQSHSILDTRTPSPDVSGSPLAPLTTNETREDT